MGHKTKFAPLRQTAVILGAGFSRAISEEMPLTNQLGLAVIARMSESLRNEIDAPKFSDSDLTFESWLTWLSEDQPYESVSVNTRRRSMFQELQSEIAAVVQEGESIALQNGFPDWLNSFLYLMHDGEGTLITLNYDTLIEHAVMRVQLQDQSGVRVVSSDIVSTFPAIDGTRFNGAPGPLRALKTFSLLKLHGSIDWFWFPNNQFGAALERVDGTISFPDELPPSELALRSGKVHYIVPPTNKKNDYFEMPQLRQTWKLAYEKCRFADRVIFMGYSLPINDIAMASMISNIARGERTEFIIVDINPDPIRKKLIDMGAHDKNIRIFSGVNCIEKFISELEFDSFHWIAFEFQKLLEKFSNAPVAIGWSPEKIAGVTEANFAPSTGILRLTSDVIGRTWDLHRPGTLVNGTTFSPYLVSSQIKSVVPNGQSIKGVEAMIPGEGIWNIGGFLRDLDFVGGNQLAENQDDWIFLHPLGRIK